MADEGYRTSTIYQTRITLFNMLLSKKEPYYRALSKLSIDSIAYQGPKVNHRLPIFPMWRFGPLSIHLPTLDMLWGIPASTIFCRKVLEAYWQPLSEWKTGFG